MADSNTPVRNTLLFIPDISGFTRFVNDTEITHSQHIVSELLEDLVASNNIGLTVSSFEGDAILFYRVGPAPALRDLLEQVRAMYFRFHQRLLAYEANRFCHCGACSGANLLTLKFVAHYGPVTRSKITDHETLFGKDVIVAHRLMKNEVPSDEYVLLTEDLAEAAGAGIESQATNWYDPHSVTAAYDFGQIEYRYALLEPLKSEMPPLAVEDYSIHATRELGEVEAVLDVPLELVFDVLSDLSFRHTWMEPLIGSDKLNSRITNNGSTHRCIINDNEKDPLLVVHDFKGNRNRVVFTESDTKNGVDTIYLLERQGDDKTLVRMCLFLRPNLIMELVFRLFLKRKMFGFAQRSIANLGGYCSSLLENGQNHTSRIVLESEAS